MSATDTFIYSIGAIVCAGVAVAALSFLAWALIEYVLGVLGNVQVLIEYAANRRAFRQWLAETPRSKRRHWSNELPTDVVHRLTLERDDLRAEVQRLSHCPHHGPVAGETTPCCLSAIERSGK